MKCKSCGRKISFIDWIMDFGRCWHCKSLDEQFGKSTNIVKINQREE